MFNRDLPGRNRRTGPGSRRGRVSSYILDWNFDEDRGRIRTGYGPENITRLRRFAIGLIQSFLKCNETVAQKMRQLCRNTRLVFDYLRMTDNACRSTAA